jgi:triosephosphate isomerase
MTHMIFAANWKMHVGADSARAFVEQFLSKHRPLEDRDVWFFPSAVALEAVARSTDGRREITVGVQNVHWEPKGAFTGELSVSMAAESGARAALVGHSERRHVFGETDEETGRKVKALLEGGLIPMLCVGETIDQREGGETLSVVERQLGVLGSLHTEELRHVVIAYEPVWAIGTGSTATPADAAEVHAHIRGWLTDRGLERGVCRILYGGSVKLNNIRTLVSEPEIDGVLVGGASLDPLSWAAMTQTPID